MDATRSKHGPRAKREIVIRVGRRIRAESFAPIRAPTAGRGIRLERQLSRRRRSALPSDLWRPLIAVIASESASIALTALPMDGKIHLVIERKGYSSESWGQNLYLCRSGGIGRRATFRV